MDSAIDDLQEMRSKRKHEEPKMDITPMIDVTFLLLIFFIVASRPDPNHAMNMPKAKFGEPIVESASVIVLIVDSGNPDLPDIHLGPSKAENKVEGTEEAMEQAIIEYVDKALDDPDMHHVMVKAEKGVRYRHVHFVYAAIGEALRNRSPDAETAEGVSIHTAVMEKKE